MLRKRHGDHERRAAGGCIRAGSAGLQRRHSGTNGERDGNIGSELAAGVDALRWSWRGSRPTPRRAAPQVRRCAGCSLPWCSGILALRARRFSTRPRRPLRRDPSVTRPNGRLDELKGVDGVFGWSPAKLIGTTGGGARRPSGGTRTWRSRDLGEVARVVGAGERRPSLNHLNTRDNLVLILVVGCVGGVKLEKRRDPHDPLSSVTAAAPGSPSLRAAVCSRRSRLCRR